MSRKIHLSLLLVICLAAGSVYCYRWNRQNRGEGESRHYITSTVTLLNAGRISFTRQDIQLVESIFGKMAHYNFPRYKPSDHTPLHKLATIDAEHPKFVGRSYYWGTYSVLCIPVYWFCRTFHIFDSNLFNAFKWTNILMMLIPLLTVVFLLKGSVRTKYLMLGAFAFPSAAQYLNWASAECCIYMFVTLSLIFLYNREYCRSSLCLSLAATLNYTLAPLALPVLFGFLRDHKGDFSLKPFHVRKEFIKKFLLLGCCYLPIFHAAFWTWLQYSRIASMTQMATTHFYWDRFFSYLFDLNLGIIVYHPVLFTVFLFSIVLIIWKHDWELLILWFAFFGIVLGYSFMFHIQTAMEGISRYGAWSAPVAVYTAVFVLERYLKPGITCLTVTASAIFCCTSLVFPFYVLGEGIYRKTDLNFIAEFVLNHHPSWYNPFFPILNRRTGHWSADAYKIPLHPIGYGKYGKILCGRKHLERFWDYMKDAEIEDVFLEKIEKQRKKLLTKKRGYYYLNIDPDCPGRAQFFTPDRLNRILIFDAERLFIRGNARKEKDYCVLCKDSVQYGPYASFRKGNYRVRISGENLDRLRFFCTANAGKKGIRITNLKCSKTIVNYEVKFDDYTQKVEFVARNPQSEPGKIYDIALTRL